MRGVGVLVVLGLLWWSPGLSGQEGELPVIPPNVEVDVPLEELDFPLVREYPDLPVWTLEELDLLREGELEIGRALFREVPGGVSYTDLFEPLPEEVEVAEEVVEELPPEIEGQYLDAYFAKRPATYLLDPQSLLSRQELADRQVFLDYHAGDSEIDLFVYLFDEKQVIPEEGEIREVFKSHFRRSSGLTALVYYFLGAPDRSLMVMSPEVGQVMPKGAVRQALMHAIEQANTRSEVSSQLEVFSTSLSIRLYWMEKEIAEARGEGRALAGVGELEVVAGAEEVRRQLDRGKEKTVLFATVGASLLVILGSVLVTWWRARKNRRYVFPEVEPRLLLGAPHAAGVGAVIHFGNATMPPSVQKEQVPDYLRKM
ncbi:MAG: hypothetical protein AAGC74_06480 [Verrucomicrobiota bacterium]